MTGGTPNQLISVSPEELKFQCNSLFLYLIFYLFFSGCFYLFYFDYESCNFDLIWLIVLWD